MVELETEKTNGFSLYCEFLSLLYSFVIIGQGLI